LEDESFFDENCYGVDSHRVVLLKKTKGKGKIKKKRKITIIILMMKRK